MKKLILSTAIVLGGLTAATAQDKEPTAMNEQKQTAVEAQVESRIEAAQDADAVVETEATVATDAATAEITAAEVAQDYKEVKASEVPQTVQDAVAKDFSGATISKAYVNAQGDYKIELATADAKKATVYANAKGEWIKNELKKQ